MPADDFGPTASWSNLRLRADLLKRTRVFFEVRGFLEVETPLLSRDTVIDRHLDPLPVKLFDDAREPQHGERFLSHPGHEPADPDRALEDEIELVAAVALLEHLLVGPVALLGTDVGHALQVRPRQPREQVDLREDLRRRLVGDVDQRHVGRRLGVGGHCR